MMPLSTQLRTIVFTLTAGLPISLSAQQPPVQALDLAFKEQFEHGQQELSGHRYKEAIDSFKEANKLQHNSCGECYLFMAIAYYDGRDFERTVENCNKAV